MYRCTRCGKTIGVPVGATAKFDNMPDCCGNLSTFFERVYVINLDRRRDRWERFMERLPQDWPFRKPERFAAIDGQKCPPPPWWKQGAGAWGCYRFHLAIIEKCLNESVRTVLILEDDAVFCDNFSQRAARILRSLPSDWGMFYLGGQHLKAESHPPEKITNCIYRAFNVNRTHAYAINGGEAMRVVYQHLCRQSWNPRHHIDHHYGVLHESRRINVYCPDEWLVGQADGFSNIYGRHVPIRFWANAASLERKQMDTLLPVVAVLGPFRSGTSCIAGMLHNLGVSMGEAFEPPQPYNPKGNYEALWLAKMCREFFREPEMRESVPYVERVKRLRKWLTDRSGIGGRSIIGAKHPTLCLMVRDIAEAWPKLKIIAVDRPVEESINSALAVGWLPTAETVIPAMVKARDDALTALNLPVLRVHYHEVIENPQDVCERLIAFCGIRPQKVQIDSAIAFVEKGLKRF